MTNQQHFDYLLRLGDNTLILGQRLGEWCGHGPILEQDIAITNIALDLIGQARSWLALAGEVEGNGRDEDAIAFLRDNREFRNLLLVEHPNEDFAYTIVRQFLFDSFNYYLHEALIDSSNDQIKAIAQKSLKEVTYHLRYSSEWMIRLGDGTEESHQKMQQALDDLWMYAEEALLPDEIDQAAHAAGIGPDLAALRPLVEAKRKAIITEATLTIPENEYPQQGGKQGMHTEALGYILAELQWMQRAYPGAEWQNYQSVFLPQRLRKDQSFFHAYLTSNQAFARMQDIIQQFRPVLVQIATPYNMGGTGFFLQNLQLIVTNEHLVRDNREVIIEAENLPRQMAKIVYWDAYYDVALLKLDTAYELPEIKFREGDEPAAGDQVLAMGHPFGLRFSSTIGNLSNNRRKHEDFYYYQHDAALNPGNSGGPLVDKQGQIIGLNVLDLEEAQGLGFSLPAAFVLETINLYLAEERNEIAARCNSCRKVVFADQKETSYCPNCGAYLRLASESEAFEPVGTPYTIELLLAALDHDVRLARRGLNTWEIQEGSARILVSYHEDSGLITGDAHLCRLPQDQLGELYEYLLRENYEDDGLTFSVKGRDVILSILIYDRYLEVESGKKRFQHLFERADHYDNILVERFGAKWKYEDSAEE